MKLIASTAFGIESCVSFELKKLGAQEVEARNGRIDFKGDFEIVSLTGTISTMNGEYYCHLHMSAGDENGNVFGGHLNRAVVSVTCEMVINIINGNVDRKYDEETGINLFEF